MEQRQSLDMESPRPEAEPVLDASRPQDPSAETSPPTLHMETSSPARCIICCEDIPSGSPSTQTSSAIRPCIDCHRPFCTLCIKEMFIGATKDISRMPPRCCRQIHLHHARAYMTDAEVAAFKNKYSEWRTPSPFYCPVPTCSVFIPNTLLPDHPTRADAGETRADSGTVTPSAPIFPCPTCAARICLSCRQPAHPGAACTALDAGIEPQLVAALKKWGYGRCPRCGHGVKRMYGCNRMECRCGAQFCWGCRRGWRECGNDYCNSRDSDSDDDAYVSGGDEEEEDEKEDEKEGDMEGEKQETTEPTAPPVAAEPADRNLDSRAALPWHHYDLGHEPDDINDQPWECEHAFQPLSLPLNDSQTRRFALEMECVECWRSIRPAPAKPDEPAEPAAEAGEDSADYAFECDDCTSLVCTACKDSMMARQLEAQKRGEGGRHRRDDDNETDGDSGDGSDDDDDDDDDDDVCTWRPYD
jgi:hypothetical protein